MRHINICGGLLVAAALLLTTVAHAEVQGLQSEAECIIPKIADDIQLVKMLNELSAQTPKDKISSPPYYTDYFDAKNNRYVFCMSDINDAILNQAKTITNNSQYPIIVFGLNVKHSGEASDPNNQAGVSLITTAGTGEIALQNLKAQGLKGPILLQGKTTLLDSTVSCDAANTAPGITVSSNNNTFRKVAINECSGGLGITGSFNNFYEVAIKKTAADETQTGGWGLTVSGGRNTFYAVMVQNYKGGAMLWGVGNRIFGMPVAEGTPGALKTVDGKWVMPNVIAGFTTPQSSPDGVGGVKTEYISVKDSMGVYFKAVGTLEASKVTGFERGVVVLANNVAIQRNFDLGGPLGAVVIAHDPITDKAYQPVVVSKNTFSTPNTINYVENGDKALYRLLGVEWMAKAASSEDDKYASYIVGKLLDQNNESGVVEVYLQKAHEENYNYDLQCKVSKATDKIELTFKQENSSQIKTIEVGEKYFECIYAADGKTRIKYPMDGTLRVVANIPTISNMSESVALATLSDTKNPITTPGQVGVIMDTGGLAEGTQIANMGGGDAPTLDVPGGQTPLGGDMGTSDKTGGNVKVGGPDVGENSGGNNMTGTVTGLEGGVPAVASGGAESAGATGLASGGGCSLSPASGSQEGRVVVAWILIMFLLPLPALLPLRNRGK